MKKAARGRGKLAGATLAIGLGRATIFDSVQAAAIENIRKKKEAGQTESGEDVDGDELV